jgi:type I restriction enzyme, S subunit
MSESKKLIPRRRFKGFIDDWILSILGISKDVRDGTHDSPSYYKKGFPLITSKNLTDSGLDMDNVSLISQSDFDKINKRSKVDSGDILFGMIGTIGNPVLVNQDNFAIKNVALIKEGGEILNIFLLQVFKSQIFDKYINSQHVGNTQKFLALSKIRELSLFIPSIKEQTKIGEFFKKIDNLISTQQKKLEKAKTLKSAYLTEMFPNEGELKPKQRFIKFNDDWKVFLIKELGDIHTGNTPSTADKINWSVGEKGHVWVTPTDIKSLLISDSERYLTDIGWEKARRIPENSILITSIASIGKNSINTVPVAFNQQINAIIPYKNNAYFILSSMEKEKKRFSQLAGHTSMAIINKTEFENFTLIIPTEQEQTQIGNFFKLLDNKIALEQKKLDKLKNIKQAYLNEMFV